MIDSDGYRPNVGIIIVNKKGQLFWGKRVYQDAWQFPQGGIRQSETPQQALFRELKEEVGLSPGDVRILGRTEGWISYDLPQYLIRRYKQPLCIGQKQVWFLLGLESADSRFNFNSHEKPEFDDWRWVDYWFPVQDVVDFKKAVYQQALTELDHPLQKFWPY